MTNNTNLQNLVVAKHGVSALAIGFECFFQFKESVTNLGILFLRSLGQSVFYISDGLTIIFFVNGHIVRI